MRPVNHGDIETGLFDFFSAGYVLPDGLHDFFFRHGDHGFTAADGFRGAVVAAVVQLQAGQGAVLINGGGEFRQGGDTLALAQVMIKPEAVCILFLGVNLGMPEGDRGRAPGGFSLEKADGVIDDMIVGRKSPIAEGRGENPVFKGRIFDLKGGKQVGIFSFHDDSTPR